MIADGMKNGEMRRGPPLRYSLCSRSIVEPADARGDQDPDPGVVRRVICSAESAIAWSAAAMANWMKMSIF
jgi:hypothetical protein